MGYDWFQPPYFKKNKFITKATNYLAPKNKKGSYNIRDNFVKLLCDLLKSIDKDYD